MSAKEIKCNVKNQRVSQLDELSQIRLDTEGAVETVLPMLAVERLRCPRAVT